MPKEQITLDALLKEFDTGALLEVDKEVVRGGLPNTDYKNETPKPRHLGELLSDLIGPAPTGKIEITKEERTYGEFTHSVRIWDSDGNMHALVVK